MSENQRTKRRAPQGAFTISRRTSPSGTHQYITSIPGNIAGPLYDADFAIVYEVVEDGVLMRPVPMQVARKDQPDDSAARALVERIASREVGA